MNFLGHLFFSDNNLELMYANLFGDFVKGKDLSAFSPVVQSGIVLHRSIDFYIDQHPEVRKLMHILYPVLPKVTGIAIDLYFDHCLEKNWKTYHSKSYKDFLDEFYAYQPEKWQEYTSEFQQFIGEMRKNRWMNHYPTFYGLQKACEGVSQRISFDTNLQEAPSIFLENKALIQRHFQEYMEHAIPFFKQKNSTLHF